MTIFGSINMKSILDYRSLGEIETISKKAARGIGLSWGISEEFGVCSRLLCQIGLPGISVLYKNINYIKKNNIVENICESNLGVFQGIRIFDELNIINFPLKLKIVYPICLIGMLLKLKGYNYKINVKSEDFDFIFDSMGVNLKGNYNDCFSTKDVVINIESTKSRCDFKNKYNNLVVNEDWNKMNKLASLTYVRSSDYSRTYGAGSFKDN